jgi:hypothetical protein
MSRLSEAQIEDLKARVDLVKLATDLGAVLRRHGKSMMGACPLCGGSKTTTRFEIKGDKWVCAACSEGGDALALVQKVKGLDFRAAVEFLGGAAQIDPEEAARLERKRQAEAEKRERAAAYYREQEIARARRLWDQGAAFSRDEVEGYLRARGCALPSTADVRGARAVPYFHGEKLDDAGRREPRVLFRGPAMLAAVRDNDGVFSAVHVTYLSSDASRKARVVDPDTGASLPAKKIRGSKSGGHIVLRGPVEPKRLFIGEGIETVLSVATALLRAGRLRASDAFWSSVDLGNLGGKALASVPHPFLKTANSRAQKVPGEVPDFDAPGILIPPSVEDLVLLGDGDSDPFTTEQAMKRARNRYARPGLHIRIVMAPAGLDFNDVLQGYEPAPPACARDGIGLSVADEGRAQQGVSA